MSYKLCYICADFYNRVSVDNKLRVQEHRVLVSRKVVGTFVLFELWCLVLMLK